jgi:hypothetical protein
MQKMAPKIEIRSTELPNLRDNHEEGSTTKQLGVFAKEDLLPGEPLLSEKSPLTATSRLNDEFCDACSTALPASSMGTSVSCPECMDTIFCSQACMDMANEMYHPALCGADISSIAKDAPPAEIADALYSLLLLRVFAMAETQGVHPLDLPEVKYITGDYESPLAESSTDIGNLDGFNGQKRTLPFSFRSNVLLPIHMLEKMDVDIFKTAHKYAPWVSNTLYAKFRGTASARQGPDGLPTVAAVYPLWCLANHSCDPNAAWEWQGVKKFWVRERRVMWKGKNQPREPGVKKGEEVLSHYCDIDLPVVERREWAAGALGGDCLCERCLWEIADSRG